MKMGKVSSFTFVTGSRLFIKVWYYNYKFAALTWDTAHTVYCCETCSSCEGVFGVSA